MLKMLFCRKEMYSCVGIKTAYTFLSLEVIITVIYHIKIRNRLAFIIETSQYVLYCQLEQRIILAMI